MSGHDIIVIGGSAGGLRALRELIAGLPSDFPAACFAVLHMQRGRVSSAAEILSRASALPVRFAQDGEPIRRGTLLLAPPDRHLIVSRDRVRLSSGPRENFWRPSVDVLFRTAAVVHRSHVVGVVLSGTLDDGAAGLSAVSACGGEALVQAPADAAFGEMPDAALRQVEGARAMALPQLRAELQRFAALEASAAPEVPRELELEARVITDDSNFISALGMPGEISPYNCPECGGPLAAQRDRPLRFRCIVGHGFSTAALEEGMRRRLESSLWVAIRLLQQRSTLGRSLSRREQEKGREFGARTYRERADEDARHAEVLRSLLMQINEKERSTAGAGEGEEQTASVAP